MWRQTRRTFLRLSGYLNHLDVDIQVSDSVPHPGLKRPRIGVYFYWCIFLSRKHWIFTSKSFLTRHFLEPGCSSLQRQTGAVLRCRPQHRGEGILRVLIV